MTGNVSKIPEGGKLIRFETDPKRLIVSREKYLNLLQRLHKKRLFGKLTIYPAIGVDGLVALFAERVMGLNLWPYNPESIIEQISPILSPELISRLTPLLENILTFISGIDVSRLNLVKKELEPYRHILPKSLMLKGMYEYIFLIEWDSDSERFYNVLPKFAEARAKHWIEEMTSWLNIRDNIVAFDRHLFPILSELDVLEEIDIGIRDIGEDFDSVYIRSVPIILLPHFVRVFKKIK